MKLVDGKFVLGTTECYCVKSTAGTGKAWRTYACKDPKTHSYCIKARCPNNKTGRRGDSHDTKPPTLETCSACKGTGIVPESLYDHVTPELIRDILKTIPVLLFKSNRSATFNEMYLGMGTISGVTDYGRYKELSDEMFVNKVKEELIEGWGQAINYVDKKTGKLCDAVAIYTRSDGYSVRPFFEVEGEKKFTGINADEAVQYGLTIYRQGGNGTLAAGLLE